VTNKKKEGGGGGGGIIDRNTECWAVLDNWQYLKTGQMLGQGGIPEGKKEKRW